MQSHNRQDLSEHFRKADVSDSALDLLWQDFHTGHLSEESTARCYDMAIFFLRQ